MTPVAFYKIDKNIIQAILGGGYKVYINEVTNKLIDFIELLNTLKTTIKNGFIEFIIDDLIVTNRELDDIVIKNDNNFVAVNVKLKKSN